jgi:hypothetical protein
MSGNTAVSECALKNQYFNRYKKLKSSLVNQRYSDISLQSLCGFFLADFVYNFQKRRFRGKLKQIFVSLFFVPRLGEIQVSKDSLFIWTLTRPDYKKLADEYKKRLGWDFQDLCLGGDLVGYKFRVDFSVFRESKNIAVKLNGLTWRERVIVFLSAVRALNSLKYFQSSIALNGLKRCLSFNSSYEYESIFSGYLRSCGVDTFSMQHGMYFEYKNEIPFDVINYENVAAKNILTWGEFSKAQIESYLPEGTQVIVFGNPMYCDTPKPVRQVGSSNKILVCLPRVIYWKEVVCLIATISAEELNCYRFVLRPHPSLDLASIKNLCSPAENIEISNRKTFSAEFDDDYMLVIAFNSTVIFESLFYGIPVAQYVSGNDEFKGVGFKEFATAHDLLELLSLEHAEFKKVGVKYYFYCDERG